MNLPCRFLLPATLIAINDIAAYIFGFFFGRTPLIKLSPKKTWEGFIGASVATITSAFLVRMIFDLVMKMQQLSCCWHWWCLGKRSQGIFIACIKFSSFFTPLFCSPTDKTFFNLVFNNQFIFFHFISK